MFSTFQDESHIRQGRKQFGGIRCFLSLPGDDVKTDRRGLQQDDTQMVLLSAFKAHRLDQRAQLKIAANEESSRPTCSLSEAVLSGTGGVKPVQELRDERHVLLRARVGPISTC
ncbi:hypothetical protein ABVT39_000950 [Epinephelus coioides]